MPANDLVKLILSLAMLFAAVWGLRAITRGAKAIAIADSADARRHQIRRLWKLSLAGGVAVILAFGLSIWE